MKNYSSHKTKIGALALALMLAAAPATNAFAANGTTNDKTANIIFSNSSISSDKNNND
ncbi:MAG: hypothetical protein ACTTJ2_02130 [Anaerovoracaceae bacterium]